MKDFIGIVKYSEIKGCKNLSLEAIVNKLTSGIIKIRNG